MNLPIQGTLPKLQILSHLKISQWI